MPLTCGLVRLTARQGPGGVSDDIGVAGVGFSVAWVGVRDAAHRQPRQVGHVVAAGTGHRDRQRLGLLWVCAASWPSAFWSRRHGALDLPVEVKPGAA